MRFHSIRAARARRRKAGPRGNGRKTRLGIPLRQAEYRTLPRGTFYLINATQQSEINEIVTALRNTLPATDKIFLVESENAMLIRATPEISPSPRSSSTTSTVPKRTTASPTRSARWTAASWSAQSITPWS